jgi:hypothetical protein
MKRVKKNDQLVIRCQSADKSLIQWAAMHLKLEQSEVIRQGIRIGIPMLVHRMRQLTREAPEALKIRGAFKRPLTMKEVHKATEGAR